MSKCHIVGSLMPRLLLLFFTRPDIVMNSAVVARAVTPHSAGDSGVEEQDDAMVPAETLCELLRRAFRLTTEKFTQYEDIVASQLEKKSPQKVGFQNYEAISEI